MNVGFMLETSLHEHNFMYVTSQVRTVERIKSYDSDTTEG